jgi:hypothetical protein
MKPAPPVTRQMEFCAMNAISICAALRTSIFIQETKWKRACGGNFV